jgi:carboxymethylenebutenolidase
VAVGTQVVEIRTCDGLAPCLFTTPPGAGPWPGAMLFMDALGVRPALVRMAKRLASHGYAVLLPDLHYRARPEERFELARVMSDPAQRERMLALVQARTTERAATDAAAFADFLAHEPRVRGPAFGCVGYCMGGGVALAAAGCVPERFAAAAAIHGARLATDAPDSPHLLAPKLRGEVYVGVAEIDPFLAPNETQRLRDALAAAGVKHEIEVHAGAEHGFAVPGFPVYQAAAAERHWERVLALFARTLR